MRIVVASEARDDLAEAVGYIAKDNPTAAARLIERIREVVTLLAEGGLDGPRSTLRPGLEVRSWPVPPLRIFYHREAGDPSVSVDLLIRTLLALGVNRKQVGRAIGAAASA